MDEVLTRFVEDIVGRVHGPMSARLFIQPLVAVIFAVRDGRRDSREGKPAYGWEILTDPDHRREMLEGGWRAVGKVFIAAIVLDAIYQFIRVKWFYPGEALVTAMLLAIVPYLLLRGPINLLLPRKSRERARQERASSVHRL